MSYREADILSSRDKEFIRALFPESPLYTFLLPDGVVRSVGQVAEATRGAVRLLEQAGMKFLDQIDPFDAGPYYGARVEDLVPLKKYRSLRTLIGEPAEEKARPYLLARGGVEGFRAVQANAVVAKQRIVVSSQILNLLGVGEGALVDSLPLP
jgi:arginine N-succinyltransferase